MSTETAKKPIVRKVSTERLHVVVSPKFKSRLFAAAERLDMSATDLIKTSVNEYIRERLQQENAAQ